MSEYIIQNQNGETLYKGSSNFGHKSKRWHIFHTLEDAEYVRSKLENWPLNQNDYYTVVKVDDDK